MIQDYSRCVIGLMRSPKRHFERALFEHVSILTARSPIAEATQSLLYFKMQDIALNYIVTWGFLAGSVYPIGNVARSK